MPQQLLLGHALADDFAASSPRHTLYTPQQRTSSAAKSSSRSAPWDYGLISLPRVRYRHLKYQLVYFRLILISSILYIISGHFRWVPLMTDSFHIIYKLIIYYFYFYILLKYRQPPRYFRRNWYNNSRRHSLYAFSRDTSRQNRRHYHWFL